MVYILASPTALLENNISLPIAGPASPQLSLLSCDSDYKYATQEARWYQILRRATIVL